MTREEAAAALEALVESRGPDWVSHTWGIARDRLAGWLEGSEDLPEWMVVVMRAHIAGRVSGDVGCFEDADHPPEVPEDVTETGWNAVPMQTVGRGEVRIERNRGELLWEAHRLELGPLSDSERNEMIDAAWVEAGRQCGVDDLLRDYGWLPDIMPHDAWNKDCSWASVVNALAAVVRDATEGDDR